MTCNWLKRIEIGIRKFQFFAKISLVLPHARIDLNRIWRTLSVQRDLIGRASWTCQVESMNTSKLARLFSNFTRGVN